MTKEYYVYTHRNDKGHVFYIGCSTKQMKRRGRRGPYQRAYDFGLRNDLWKKMAANGVFVSVVFETSSKDRAYRHEHELINSIGRSMDGGILANHCHGGEGAPGQVVSISTRRKKSLQKRGKLNPMWGKTGSKNPTSRMVVNLNTGDEYGSVKIAAKASGMVYQTLYNMLSGHRKNTTSMRFS